MATTRSDIARDMTWDMDYGWAIRVRYVRFYGVYVRVPFQQHWGWAVSIRMNVFVPTKFGDFRL